MIYEAGSYDVVVIGAGHAGCEAALASARMGCQTLLATLSMEGIGLMPCNPSIGGPAKAQLVREIDALGGEMGINIDKANLQMRMINTGKGPAVQSLRAQADKHEYHRELMKTILQQEGLHILMAEIEDIQCQDEQVCAVITRTGARFACQAVVVTSGTYLKGRIIVGDLAYEGGPANQFPSVKLADSLRSMGITLGRFKTGTPPRIDRKSVDFSKMSEQPGDPDVPNFSFITPKANREQLSCYLTYSNKKTHQIVMDNLNRSPLYTGVIKGKGPRYCPSFEDKVVRFAHKESHQLFVEPEGRDTDEMYVQGLNTSLPEDVQMAVLRSIPGLENVRIIRTGYAIEYDYVLPSQLKLSLESKKIAGLFTAGQINGTSGYEEAAAQGLIAGINAALKVKNQPPFILKRSEAYIGVLIDDLISKESDEPYRLLTSRAEYRLLLRQDNADLRLTEMGRSLGLVDDYRWQIYQNKKRQLDSLIELLQKTTYTPADKTIAGYLQKKNSAPIKDRVSLWELLRRPEVNLSDYVEMGLIPPQNPDIMEQLEIQSKYEGYINKQREQVIRFEKMENKLIPADIDYDTVSGLSSEALQRLKQFRPESIGQASRISGITPADINVLLIFLKRKEGIR
ncbi:Glucose-inhibited division protein A [Syntrophomonas zehnderi OL-4]|uniref:tRNA uridine 5-carboxymethylaminomethyl modification enzyme MnmG n=1 Tax=Syntrophomonas zehnderi OL-4 TaxID=690567 RepID=A0A0E4GAX4_9FIRM|nr:tRNA uridine-5-carboxymethylaminomethyl(34) synthesis enzyme MnmG [Syntrophomonas zehnderi]CFX25392.1 Glucose-inhibited division protein A [Syntrophomonas zehnderi OL-4]